MYPDSPELNAIWQRVDLLMQDQRLRNVLKHMCYTDTLHRTFEGIINGDVAPEENQLVMIFKPLQRFYKARAKQAEKEIAELREGEKSLSNKVTPLFADKFNPALQNIFNANSETEKSHQKSIGEDKEVLDCMDWALSDPRLKQKNPALQGYALDY